MRQFNLSQENGNVLAWKIDADTAVSILNKLDDQEPYILTDYFDGSKAYEVSEGIWGVRAVTDVKTGDMSPLYWLPNYENEHYANF